MDAHTLYVLLWVAMGGAGFVAGLVGLAATKRSLQEQSLIAVQHGDEAVAAR